MIRVAVLWNDSIFSESFIRADRGVTIGTHKKAAVRVPSESMLSTDLYQLFAKGGGEMGAQLTLSNQMGGWLEVRGERQELSGGADAQFLQVGDRGLINITDELAVFFYVVNREQDKYGVPLLADERPQLLVAFAFALLVPRVTAKWDVRWKHHEHVASTRRWDVDDVGCAVDLCVASVEVVEAVAEC